MPYLHQRPSRTTLRRTALAALTAGFVFAVVPTGARETTTAKAMRDAATAFLATLDPAQTTATTFAFTSEERENWFFTPVPRKGLAYFSMTGKQRAAAVALLKTGLSAKGYDKVEHIRSLESVLWDIEGDAGKKPFVNGDGHPHRYPERYLFTIFGTPSATEPWGWRFEGHHISQNWTVVSGNAIASSPQFFGSNPAEVRTGPKTGLRVLAAEEDLARTLLQSLDEAQRKAAMIDPKAPNDILTTNKHQAERLPDAGVAYNDLTKGQQQALWKLIEEYAFAQTATIGQARIATIKKDGPDKIRFAWMGVAEKGGPHYYRVQGANFAIEYDNTQNNNNHIHAVWRDFNGDFGRDILAEHYKAEHKPSAAPGRF
jgi:uncharacterized protein DUF3500